MHIQLHDITDSRKMQGNIRLLWDAPITSSYIDYNEHPVGTFTEFTHYQLGSQNLIIGTATCEVGGVQVMTLTASARLEYLLTEAEIYDSSNDGLIFPAIVSNSPHVYLQRNHYDIAVACKDLSGNMLYGLATGDPTSGAASFYVPSVNHVDDNDFTGHISLESIDQSIPYSVEIESIFERHVTYSQPYGGAQIFTGYAAHYDPYGLPPGSMVIYYVPLTYKLKFNVNGTTREYNGTYTEAQAAEYRYGLKDTTILLNKNTPSPGYALDPVNIASGEITWNQNSSPLNADTLVSGTASATIVDGLVSLITDSSTTGVVRYSATCPAYSAQFDVAARDMDYAAVGATVDLMAGDITGTANGSVLQQDFEGRWEIALNYNAYEIQSISSDDTGGATDHYYADHEVGSITNLSAINQPDFGMDVAPADDPRWTKFNDGRIDMSVDAALDWADAITFSVPESQSLFSFAGHTWTATTGVTTSVVDSKLQVVVASGAVNPRITHDATGVKFNGGRYIECAYTGGSANLSIAGRKWAIASDANTVDVLVYQGQPAYSDTQVGNSLGDAGTIYLELQPGTYVFDKLSLVRNPVTEDRSLFVRIFNAFVSDVPGDGRSNDAPTLVMTPLPGDAEWAQRCRNRIGYVSVDGIRTEIFGVEHSSTAAGLPAVVWHHSSIGLNSEYLISPSNGFVSVAVNAPPDGWSISSDANDDVDGLPIDWPAAWLLEGTVGGANSVSIDMRPTIKALSLPFGEVGDYIYRITKYFGAKIAALALNADGSPATKVTVNQYKNGELIHTADYIPSPTGHIVTESLPQSTCRWFTVESVTGDTLTISGLSSDYSGYDVFLPRTVDEVIIEPIRATVIDHDVSAGTMQLSSTISDIYNGLAVVYIPYTYDVICGSSTIPLTLRNRNYSFAQFVLAMGIGILYKGSVAGQPILFKASETGQPILYLD